MGLDEIVTIIEVYVIVKKSDNQGETVATLEKLLKEADESRKKTITVDIRKMKAGLRAEKEATYLIDFEFQDSADFTVIHDLRLETKGRVAQIDHLLIHKSLLIFVLETKNFHSGLKVTEEGDFLRWNKYANTYEGMSSPFRQCQRHIKVLQEAVKGLGKEVSLAANPVFEPVVVVSANSRVMRPESLKTDYLVKAENVGAFVEKSLAGAGTIQKLRGFSISLFGKLPHVELAKALAALHKPIQYDYRAKYGLNKLKPQKKTPPTAKPEKAEASPVKPASSQKETSKGSPVNCPKCGKAFVKRIAKKGPRAGKSFWGCSSFPKCKYTENID